MTHPEISLETATYGGGVFYFLLPASIQLPRVDMQRSTYQEVLASTQLPHRLGEFLNFAFSTEAINRCDTNGSRIRIEATPNIPGSIGHARIGQRIQLMWQAFAQFYGAQDENSQRFWNLLPYVRLERGVGRDLGEAGLHMARFMCDICGVKYG